MSVYRVTELIGTSTESWEDAARTAVTTATKTLRDLRVAEVVKQDFQINRGGAIVYRIKLHLLADDAGLVQIRDRGMTGPVQSTI
ncbi:MAG TPA: dodecin domain-containing protein, partial [Nakamurella sp.]|nr:dodecin domain-containing protein [Nakamurella sp.]